MQHEGLGYFYGSADIRPFLMRAPLLEAPLHRCFIGGVDAASKVWESCAVSLPWVFTLTLYGFLPVIPHTNCIIWIRISFLKTDPCHTVQEWWKSRIQGPVFRSTGITGHWRCTNWRIKALSSIFCQGPIPELPTKIAADLILPMCSSRACCQGNPGRSSHSSSHGRILRLRSRRAICLTSGLSSELWHMKTS